MTTRQPRLSKEEHARLGTAIYEQRVRPQVETDNQGKIVAIDVETGAFEVAEDTLTASERLLTCYPEAQIWCVRIGTLECTGFDVTALLIFFVRTRLLGASPAVTVVHTLRVVGCGTNRGKVKPAWNPLCLD